MNKDQNDSDIVGAYNNNPAVTASQANQILPGLRLLSPQEVGAVAGGPEVDVSSGVTP